MAVFRIEKTKDYTVMANHHLKNKRLTLKAKGLQAYRPLLRVRQRQGRRGEMLHAAPNRLRCPHGKYSGTPTQDS